MHNDIFRHFVRSLLERPGHLRVMELLYDHHPDKKKCVATARRNPAIYDQLVWLRPGAAAL